MSGPVSSNNLASLPVGIVELGGNAFDVRGVIRLNSANPGLAYHFPTRIEGIRLGRHCRALHFLQSAAWARVFGIVAGQYVIHYADGTRQIVPLITGENLTDWFAGRDNSTVLSKTTKVAWRGENPVSRSLREELRLFDFRWENPRPDKEIASIDFVSAMAEPAPFLLAITTEEEGDRKATERLCSLARARSSPAELAVQGELFARQGRWSESATEYAKALELEPTNHVPYRALSSLLVARGDWDGYRRHCQRTVARFGGTKVPSIAEQMAKACLTLPSSGVDPARIESWADTSLTANPTNSAYPYYQIAKGWSEYRRGRFAQAVAWLSKSLNAKGAQPYRVAEGSLLRAMAEHQLKQPELARADLSAALNVVEVQMPKAQSDLGIAWLDWIITRQLVKEAKALIEGTERADRDAFSAKE
jgi:tetratricopeptide (TPR) repeat protein